jgi:hypothetical protein
MLNLYKQVAEEMNIPVEVVELAYKSYWKFIRKTIQELPLKEDLSEEEFAKLKTNFNIVSLGKLSCTYDRYRRVKLREKYKNENVKNKENQTSI